MSFDTLAPIYERMERLFTRDRMQLCRTEFLGCIPTPNAVLIAGEGHGRFLVEFRDRFPDAKVTIVESSAGMIGQARKNLARAGIREGGIRFLQEDILSWNPPADSFDLIVTNFFLDCFRADQLADLIPRLAASTMPSANWLVADFQLAPAGWRRLRGRVVFWMLYAFFRATTRLSATTLTPPDRFLEEAGFRPHRRKDFDHGLLHSDWWTRAS